MKFAKLFLIAILFFLAMPQPKVMAQPTEIHVVKKGESIWIIAQKWQAGMDEIIKENGEIRNPALIYPGQIIRIPMIATDVKTKEAQVLTLVNKERAKAGLKPLANDWEVARVARIKSQDMSLYRYFSHKSPRYGSPFDMLKKFGIKYRTAGENIAQGQRSAAEVMAAWMASPGHRQNILNPAFTHIGVGFEAGDEDNIWTQMFIGK